METIKSNTLKLGKLVHLISIPFFTLYAKDAECSLFLYARFEKTDRIIVLPAAYFGSECVLA